MKARKTLMSLCLLLALPLAAQQKNYVSEVWVADQGNGKYKNPVLYADYSDPDAYRVGDIFQFQLSARTSDTSLQRFGELEYHWCCRTLCTATY